MRGPSAVSAIVVATCAILVGVFPVVPDEVPSSCPYHEESCYFSENYISARANFREAASDAGARLYVLRISDIPDLTIDLAVLEDVEEEAARGSLRPTLVHLSGVHGVEGYAGSAIQLALLRGWTNNNKQQQHFTITRPRGVRVVLVHAINPYGFHCGRRFNENNIDLNRNVLTPTEFHELIFESSDSNKRRALYNNHEWMFNWRQKYKPIIDDIRFILYAIYGIAILGLTHVKRAIVSGQYHQPNGLFYGGGDEEQGMMAKSHQLLIPLLQQVASPASIGIIIDLHTGLGPSGVDTLIPEFGIDNNNNNSNRLSQWEALHAIFGGSVGGSVVKEEEARENVHHIYGTDFLISAATPAEDTLGASSGYEYASGTTGRYMERFNWNRSLFLTQEFGTYPSPIVLRGMVIERAEWLFAASLMTKNDSNDTTGCNGTTARGARAVTNAFYIKTPWWKRKVVQRGLRVVEQALHALVDNNGEKVPLTNH